MFKVKYAISKIKDGNMSFKYGNREEVLNNRKLFLENNNFLFDNTVCMVVEMKDNIVIVNENDKGKGLYDPESAISCDAMITNSSSLNLFLVVADCLPILFFDSKHGALGLIHGG
jgi:copper oxidase (laccase) domain-containing protein